MNMHKIMARKGGYYYIGLNSAGRPTCVVDCTAYHGIDERGLARAEKIVWHLGESPMDQAHLESAITENEGEPCVVAVLRQYL